MPDPTIQFLQKETYIRTIENAEGTRLFNSIFVKKTGSDTVIDVCGDGEKSCAYFVSSVLTLVGIFDKPSTTVATVQNRMSTGGFMEISTNEIEAGDIVIWEKQLLNNEENEHIGFALNKEEAMSTYFRERKVTRHPLTFGATPERPERKIDRAFRPPFLS